MPAKMKRLQARIDDDTEIKILELGRIWGPFEELKPSAVVRRCVELAHQMETAGKTIVGKPK
jgi:hypothetical protein